MKIDCEKCIYGPDGPDERLSICCRCIDERIEQLSNVYHADDECYYDDDDLPF